jgi:hypothetical protein
MWRSRLSPIGAHLLSIQPCLEFADDHHGSGANRQHEHARTCCAEPPSGPERCIPDCGRSSTLSTETSQPELALADAVHQLDTDDRSRRITEPLEAEHHSDSLLDAPMVLLNQVV